MYKVTWVEVDQFIEDVFNEFNNKELTGVYGLPRGGLVLAVMLSHKLNIPLLMAPTKNCLIVDDICDTGESLIHFIKNSSSLDKVNYFTATMFLNNTAIVKPDFSSLTKTNEWIVFPWEVE
jgi:hypoxanthine phosphoribosyltransferase